MKKIFTLLIISFFTLCISAQVLTINGTLVIDNASTAGTRILISRNGEPLEEKLIDKRGRFNLRFSLDADYRLVFEKSGFVTKIVSINAEVPEEIIEANPDFPPIRLIINLLPYVDDVDLSIFEQPVAILTYDYELDDFTFDKDYAGRIQPKVSEAEKEIRRILSQKGAELLAREKKFNDLVAKGEENFSKKRWLDAIENWTQALEIKKEEKQLERRIQDAKDAMLREEEEQRREAARVMAYNAHIASADSLFKLTEYATSKEKYLAASQLDPQNKYPTDKINEIDKLLDQLEKDAQEASARKALEEKYKKIIEDADRLYAQKDYPDAVGKYKEALALNFIKEYPQTQITTIEGIIKAETQLANSYNEQISAGDQFFNTQEYTKAIESYNSALSIKPQEAYPKEMIGKSELAIADLQRKAEEDAARQKQEEQQRKELMERYNTIIASADKAFGSLNYNIARSLYTEADQLKTGEKYPENKIKEIDQIINSSKYKKQLEDYNKNIASAEKEMTAKNYAGAKVYYERALSILPMNKEEIDAKIAEIEKIIEEERVAAIEKEYAEHIKKADDAFEEKSYAIAKFYYQKALEVKKNDRYARRRLEEVDEFINERSEKTLEL